MSAGPPNGESPPVSPGLQAHGEPRWLYERSIFCPEHLFTQNVIDKVYKNAIEKYAVAYFRPCVRRRTGSSEKNMVMRCLLIDGLREEVLIAEVSGQAKRTIAMADIAAVVVEKPPANVLNFRGQAPTVGIVLRVSGMLEGQSLPSEDALPRPSPRFMEASSEQQQRPPPKGVPDSSDIVIRFEDIPLPKAPQSGPPTWGTSAEHIDQFVALLKHFNPFIVVRGPVAAGLLQRVPIGLKKPAKCAKAPRGPNPLLLAPPTDDEKRPPPPSDEDEEDPPPPPPPEPEPEEVAEEVPPPPPEEPEPEPEPVEMPKPAPCLWPPPPWCFAMPPPPPPLPPQPLPPVPSQAAPAAPVAEDPYPPFVDYAACPTIGSLLEAAHAEAAGDEADLCAFPGPVLPFDASGGALCHAEDVIGHWQTVLAALALHASTLPPMSEDSDEDGDAGAWRAPPGGFDLHERLAQERAALTSPFSEDDEAVLVRLGAQHDTLKAAIDKLDSVDIPHLQRRLARAAQLLEEAGGGGASGDQRVAHPEYDRQLNLALLVHTICRVEQERAALSSPQAARIRSAYL